MTNQSYKTTNGLWHFERNLRKYEGQQISTFSLPDSTLYKTRPQRQLDNTLSKPKSLTIPFNKLCELNDKQLKSLVKKTLKFNKACSKKFNNN